jgi:hypothetical protein
MVRNVRTNSTPGRCLFFYFRPNFSFHSMYLRRMKMPECRLLPALLFPLVILLAVCPYERTRAPKLVVCCMRCTFTVQNSVPVLCSKVPYRH